LNKGRIADANVDYAPDLADVIIGNTETLSVARGRNPQCHCGFGDHERGRNASAPYAFGDHERVQPAG
jgi:hypothetical protein